MSKVEVICYGDINVDYVGNMNRLPEVDEELPIENLTIHCGGAATNVAVGLARLGHSVSFLGCTGDDEIGKRLLSELAEDGVIISNVIVKEDMNTGMAIAILDNEGERRLMTYSGANNKMEVRDISENIFEDARIFHLSSPQLHMVEPLLKYAKEKGLITSFDPGSIICRLGISVIEPLLHLVDVLFLNQVEYQQLMGSKIPSNLRYFCDLGCKMVIYKKGREGSILLTKEGLSTELPGFDVVSVDSTGAGDAFAAGFLSAMLRNEEMDMIILSANAMGAIAVTARGAKVALPDRNKLEKFIYNHK
ncbi:conserved protein of unknown function [Petrocella atlantisensis]|uniref:Carbohydrate kinase PfkB domain-containing protein n=1 Tax=Petrocella atlantisensis TaxID=2173034 RepID=A0A3P7PE43_9FIRM|nr:carbohydrate kinase family protein [Petrocella atlantisensis]PKM55707.1 MAG: hypothetical protein CVV00_03005 [Firmicutes bacterium HGW-Firmicutes-5]VDN48343.1 conserved protein of unknown function [Petrocella atlantisensis]